MPIGTLFIAPEWYLSEEGQNVLSSLRHKHTNKRKAFCLLEKPIHMPTVSPDVFEYKIFLSGKSGVGKSSMAATLSANDVSFEYHETLGIQKSTVYWPAKIVEVGKVLLFKLHLWDAGDNALNKFDHLLPAVKENADAAIFVFSFVDKSSFTDIPHRIARVTTDSPNLCKFVIGSKLDLQTDIEVTQNDVVELESRWSVKVLALSNILSMGNNNTRWDNEDIASTLNYLCDQLWLRDQMTQGRIPPPSTLQELDDTE